MNSPNKQQWQIERNRQGKEASNMLSERSKEIKESNYKLVVLLKAYYDYQDVPELVEFTYDYQKGLYDLSEKLEREIDHWLFINSDFVYFDGQSIRLRNNHTIDSKFANEKVIDDISKLYFVARYNKNYCAEILSDFDNWLIQYFK